MSLFGRYQAPEAPSSLATLHVHDGSPLQEVDWEPKVGVLDQSDLFAQGIHVSTFIPGAQDVGALGSCTANAFTGALSNLLTEAEFIAAAGPYTDTVSAEKFAIGFYHECTDQTGDSSTEWPPTDCGSSGPYVVSEAKRLGYVSGGVVTHGAQGIVSLMQTGCLLQGSPWFYSWMQTDADGFIDADGTAADLQNAIDSGVAGGHETVLSAVEKLTLLENGQVDPFNTTLRARNSWSAKWGDNGNYRVHLSTLVALGAYCDWRQLQAK